MYANGNTNNTLVRNALGAQEKDIITLSADYYSENNTEYLQSVLDSSVTTIIIPKEPGPWYTGPLFINRDDLTIIFEEGARIEAREGDFQLNDSCLIEIFGKKNITFLGSGGTEGFYMRKKDYQSPSYKKGEWRHGISLKSAENIRIEGLTIAESGGDGIYIGQAKKKDMITYCQDIFISNCRIMDNHRQGISVISVENLYIKDTLCWNTKGTIPMAGIDFEPNRAVERLVNCHLENCWFEKNGGPGIHIFLRKFDKTTIPLDITIENCTSRNNFLLMGINITRLSNSPAGTITLKNNTFRFFNKIPRNRSLTIIEE